MKILITGGAGSVGKFLTEQFYGKHELLIIDKDDYLLWDLSRKFPKAKFILGDVRNTIDVRYPVKWADLIIHAAAYKNIEITELNPLATCDNDFYGTVSVVHEIQKHHGKQFILISTDKAVYPLSTLGAAKMLAEKFVLEADTHADCALAIARFVNVVETRGNVFEAWREQKEQGRPFEITDIRMERHFNTVANVQTFFEKIMLRGINGGEIFIPDVPKQKVIDVLFEIYGKDAPYIEIGARLNERLYDPLYTAEEHPFIKKFDGYLKIDYRQLQASFAKKDETARELSDRLKKSTPVNNDEANRSKSIHI